MFCTFGRKLDVRRVFETLAHNLRVPIRVASGLEWAGGAIDRREQCTCGPGEPQASHRHKTRSAVGTIEPLQVVQVTPAHKQERSGSDPEDRTRLEPAKLRGLALDGKRSLGSVAVLHVVAMAYLMLHRGTVRFVQRA